MAFFKNLIEGIKADKWLFLWLAFHLVYRFIGNDGPNFWPFYYEPYVVKLDFSPESYGPLEFAIYFFLLPFIYLFFFKPGTKNHDDDLPKYRE